MNRRSREWLCVYLLNEQAVERYVHYTPTVDKVLYRCGSGSPDQFLSPASVFAEDAAAHLKESA
jgi:hypothetical protein